MEAMATIVSSLVIAFMYGWKLAVIIIGFLPVFIWTARFQARVFEERPKSEKVKTGHAGEVRGRAHVVIVYRFPPSHFLFHFLAPLPPLLPPPPNPTRSLGLSVCLSLSLCLSVCLCLSLSVCLCLSLSVSLSLSTSLSLSVCLCLSACLPACLPACLSVSVSLLLHLWFCESLFISSFLWCSLQYSPCLLLISLSFPSSRPVSALCVFSFWEQKYVSLSQRASEREREREGWVGGTFRQTDRLLLSFRRKVVNPCFVHIITNLSRMQALSLTNRAELSREMLNRSCSWASVGS